VQGSCECVACLTENRCHDRVRPAKLRARAQGSAAVMVLLDVASGVSRIHASRRVFELLARHDVDLPVIHRRAFPAGAALGVGLGLVVPSGDPTVCERGARECLGAA